MRERILQLARGEMKQNAPELIFSGDTIHETIPYGKKIRGEIRVSSRNQVPVRGLVYSDDSRVVLLQSSFHGLNSSIPYEVKAENIEAGTTLQGCFRLVYNGGEHSLPYRFDIRRQGENHVELKTLEDLAQYARTMPAKAREYFDSRDFTTCPFFDDLALRAMYDGLRRAVNRRNSLEEFLCGAGAKEPVVLSVDETFREHMLEEPEMTRTITIHRSTWGHILIRVSADHPAITLSQTRITDEDFQDDTFQLTYTIHREKLHGGRNYGRILLTTLLQNFKVEMSMTSMETRGRKKRREHHNETLEFHKTLLKYQAGEDQSQETLDYLQYCWEEMTKDAEPTEVEQLQRAAIALWKGDRELASMLLEEMTHSMDELRREQVDLYCAFLYLQSQVTDSWEKREEMLRILHGFESDGEVSEFLYRLMLTMDEGLSDCPREVLGRLKSYYRAGSRSPFLYLEACRIYNRYPDILREMGSFELQALLFGARRGFLKEDTAIYLASLTGQERGYRSFLGRTLKLLYQRYERDEILGGICSILIRGDRREPKNFKWFALGVERDVRLTRLYDYYLYTVSIENMESFPREILLYFSYNSPKDPESQKKLYGNLLQYSGQDGHMMKLYEKQIRDFAWNQLQRGVIDQDMAQIYRHVLTLEDPGEKIARYLPDVLYSVKITCEHKNLTEAIVVYGELEEERSVPMKNGVACLPVYTPLGRILFADASGNRFAGISYEKSLLMENHMAWKNRCRELYPRHTMMRLADCSEILQAPIPRESGVSLLRKELEVRNLHRQYRKELMTAIARYVLSLSDPDEEDVLTCIHYQGLPVKVLAGLTEVLIRQGQLSDAGRMVRQIGFDKISGESLSRLVSLTIQNGLFERDEFLLDLCYALFLKGQCDDVTMEYLCTHYNSTTDRMITILAEADAKGYSVCGMDEKILAQMLFTGHYVGMDLVFNIYLKRGTGDRSLIFAYLAVKCQSYFMEHKGVEADIFRFVRHLLEHEKKGPAVPLICVLALTRYYADQEILSEKEQKLCEELVLSLYSQGLVFAWMKKLSGKISLPEALENRTWIEYHGAPDQQLELSLSVLPEMEGQKPMIMVLPQVYPGIYVRSVLLFDGEEMAYEIRGKSQGETTILERDVCRGAESHSKDQSRFAMLNRLQKQAEEACEEQQWQQEVLDYALQEVWTEELFSLE